MEKQRPDIFTKDLRGESITSVLGNILQHIEFQYGKRNPIYTILGIELFDGGPDIHFSDYNPSYIYIRITPNCRFDMTETVLQVSHEAVHCLHPTTIENVTYLEEGLATLFSLGYTNSYTGEKYIDNQHYIQASNLVSELLKYKPTIIKELRTQESSISMFTPKMLIDNCPDIPLDLAEKLTTRFSQSI